MDLAQALRVVDVEFRGRGHFRVQGEEGVRHAIWVIDRKRPLQPGGQARDRLGGQRMGERLVEDVAALPRVERVDVQHMR